MNKNHFINFKMNSKFKYCILFCLAFAFNCTTINRTVTKPKTEQPRTKTVVSPPTPPTTPTPATKPKPDLNIASTTSPIQLYIDTYAPIAKAEMRKHKVPASITLAQGILESGSGLGRLSSDANNHFGIKCHDWQGEKIYHDDDASQECFRKYENPASSFEDHSQFLTGRKRYANLFELPPNDYKGWANGLRAAGYATDTKYPQKLISLIERYKLYEHDEAVLGNSTKQQHTEKVNTNVLKYTVSKGDTLYALSKRFKTTVEAIKVLNNLNSNDLALGQELSIPN